MRKHIESDHKNDESQCEFVWSVISSFKKPMLRQLTKAVHINNTAIDEILNLKNEYFQNNIKYLQLNQSDDNTCRECSGKFNQKMEVIEHFNTVHKRIRCNNCDYVSFGSRDMKNHKEAIHT